LLVKKSANIKLVILAGGFISEQTQQWTKPIVLIGNKPIIWHIIL